MATSRHRFSISLRWLLIAVVILGVAAGLGGRYFVRKASGTLVARLHALNADISYDYEAISRHKIEPLSERCWNLGYDYPDDRVTSVEWNGHGTGRMNFITDAEVPLLSNLPKLKQLKMGGPEITDAGLALLASNPNLEGLEIVDASISAKGIESLGKLKKLTSLSIASESFVPASGPFHDDVLLGLPHLKGLTHFRLFYTQRFGPGLQGLDALTGLQSVELYGESITDADLVHLQPMASLKKVTLFRTAVKGPGLQHLGNAKQLHELELWGSKIDDTSVNSWEHLSHLKILHLRETEIADGGVAMLDSITELSELDLALTPITDKGLESVARCSNLCSLDIMHTHVSDDGVRKLVRLKKLERLVMGPHQSRKVAEELVAANSQLNVSYLDNTGWIDIDAPKK